MRLFLWNYFQLNQYKWDKENLLEAYYSKDLGTANNHTKPENLTNDSQPLVCEICYTERNDVVFMASLECGHAYCNTCWSEYLTTKIMDEGASQTIACPTNECDTLVDDKTVYRLIGSTDVIMRYQVTAKNAICWSYPPISNKRSRIKNYNINFFYIQTGCSPEQSRITSILDLQKYH